jgi:glycosyltransferase involved in cell wall biosynthesis
MKRLLIFTTWQSGDEIDLSPESNLWYLKRYESYFDEVTHVVLCGHFSKGEYKYGNSRYVSVGTGNHKLDLILAPWRLLRFAAKYKPAAYLTVEQVWLFWVASLVKLFLSAKIVLLPITHPEAMYKLTGRSLSGVLPIWLERWLLKASYITANKVVTCKNSGSYSDWMEEDPIIRRKLLVTETLPEAIPTQAFFDALERAKKDRKPSAADEPFKLIYVGRLHPEKSVEDIIRMMAILRDRDLTARLAIIGDGSDRERLEDLTRELDLSDRIEFLGWKSNADLPHYLVKAHAFVSPSAGGALREVALCGLPVITYEMDWVKGFLVNEETFLAAQPSKYKELADAAIRLINDTELRRRLSSNILELGRAQWSHENIETSIGQIYSVLL